jgi:hypothetical protein
VRRRRGAFPAPAAGFFFPRRVRSVGARCLLRAPPRRSPPRRREGALRFAAARRFPGGRSTGSGGGARRTAAAAATLAARAAAAAAAATDSSLTTKLSSPSIMSTSCICVLVTAEIEASPRAFAIIRAYFYCYGGQAGTSTHIHQLLRSPVRLCGSGSRNGPTLTLSLSPASSAAPIRPARFRLSLCRLTTRRGACATQTSKHCTCCLQ